MAFPPGLLHNFGVLYLPIVPRSVDRMSFANCLGMPRTSSVRMEITARIARRGPTKLRLIPRSRGITHRASRSHLVSRGPLVLCPLV